jgi:hypothetical protein
MYRAFLPVICLALAFCGSYVTPAVAEWDIEEFDSCLSLTQEQKKRLLGDSDLARHEHYRYCCYKSGGEFTNRGCVAPPAESSRQSTSGPGLSIKPPETSPGKGWRLMQDRPSIGQLQSVCSDVHGNFTSVEDGQRYSCTTENCDGAGGSCTIDCDGSRNCYAKTPSIIKHPVSLHGLLQNGDNVVRGGVPPQNSSGSGNGGSESPSEPESPDGQIL